MILDYIFCALIGYFIGTSNMAYYISKARKVNLRDFGSGNLGTSNTTAILGARAGTLTFIHDFVKVFLASWICSMLCPDLEYAIVISATACVLGHIYPFYLDFYGGKGFASYIAMVFLVNWKFGLFMLLSMIMIALLADWIVAGTFYYITVTPIFLLLTKDWIFAVVTLIASISIFCKHIENIQRKLKHQEMGIKEVLFKKSKK